MKTRRIPRSAGAAILALALCGLPALAGKVSPDEAARGLAEFKKLVGTWEGTNQNGDTVLKTAHDEGHKIVERLIREAGGVY